jgi:hypothetical protein
MYDCSACRIAKWHTKRNCDGARNPAPIKTPPKTPAHPNGYASAIPATREHGKDFASARRAWIADDAPMMYCLRLRAYEPTVRLWLRLYMLVTEGGVRFDARDVPPLWSRVVSEVSTARAEIQDARKPEQDEPKQPRSRRVK